MAESLRLKSAERTRNATTLVIERAVEQDQAIARWQLLECGLSPAGVARWISAGRLRRIHPGVYALGAAALSRRGRMIAALLYAGKGAAFSHGYGAWWLDLLPAEPSTIQLSAPGRRSSLPGVAVHHPRKIERVMHHGLPVLAVTTLLPQVAHTLPFNTTRKVLAEADFRQLLEPGVIQASLGPGRNGSHTLRRALASHMPQLAATDNDFEDDFLFLCERFGIELPEVNVRIGRFRPDMLWRALMLIVELDGEDAHTKPAQVASDHRKDMALRAMGFTVIRYTWAQVNFEPEAVAADLRRQLGHA